MKPLASGGAAESSSVMKVRLRFARLAISLVAILVLTLGRGVTADAQEHQQTIQAATQEVEAHPAGEDEDHHDSSALGRSMPLWSVLPFAALLGCIAIMPLVNGHWWEHNHNKAIVAAGLALPLAAYLVSIFGEAGRHQLMHSAIEYVSFIMLLGSLFVISGGIYLRGTLAGTPVVNTLILLTGGLMASFIGTTGASMVLIRPLLRANASRPRKAHIVVFFIFVVSNCGGLLTPLGDPPLYLGFLKGVPFQWTFQLWQEWLTINGALLAMFFAADNFFWARDKEEALAEQSGSEKLGLEGWLNIALLLGVVAAIYGNGNGIFNGGRPWPTFTQEGILLVLTLVSYFSTRRDVHLRNRFSFVPIVEVAIVFAGIFVTMIPALLILNANGKSLGISEPWQFFWVSGLLSSVLDNAPTYLTFAATAAGLNGLSTEGRYLAEFLRLPEAARAGEMLAAISCGSVFMGANTYIGNGPNFMVKAIAEEGGVKMPSFFAYMIWSGCILLPLFVLMTFLFFM